MCRFVELPRVRQHDLVAGCTAATLSAVFGAAVLVVWCCLQELMVSGQWSIEHSFDDFRLVLGDSMM